MKIQSRNQKIEAYNEKYPERIDDPADRIREYFRANNLDLDKACKKAARKALRIMEEREYESVRIVLYEEPFFTERPRVYRGHAFSPNAAANKQYFEKAIGQVVEGFKLITSPAELTIEAYLEMPSTVPPDEVILFEAKMLNPATKPDYDNIEKCYTDMLTDVIMSDDDLFYRAEIVKWYSLLPRVEMRITYLKKNESDYIYKKLKNRKTIREGLAAGTISLERLDYS